MIDKQQYCPKCGGKAPYNKKMDIGEETVILPDDEEIGGTAKS